MKKLTIGWKLNRVSPVEIRTNGSTGSVTMARVVWCCRVRIGCDGPDFSLTFLHDSHDVIDNLPNINNSRSGMLVLAFW